MKKPFVALGLVFLCLQLGAGPALGQPAKPAPARPLDPIAAIVQELKTHDVIALGEGNHRNEQGAAFRQKLYHDRRFQMAVNDIVVESGNGYYQDIMDRYISGEDVPEKELRKAWLITTQPNPIWDVPIYADMFRTIREVNKTLPKTHQLRVILGDTPYILDAATHEPRTDVYPAETIEHDVIAKHRKALVVFGDMHFLRRTMTASVPGGPTLHSNSMVNLLEKAGVKVFSIWTFTALGDDLDTLQPDVDKWPNPSLTLIKNTTLGEAPFIFYYPKGSGVAVLRGPDGNPVRFDMAETIGGNMQEQFDALLYVGKKKDITLSEFTPAICGDADYVELRASRLAALPKPPTGPDQAQAFRDRCKEVLAGH